MSDKLEVIETGSFAVPAEKLWALVADFGAIDKIMDGIEECVVEGEGVGATRTIPVGESHVVEALDVLDPEKMTLTYSIVSGPMPFKDYSSTMVVCADGEGACTLTWTGRFEPAGVPAEKAARIASGVYRGGLAGYGRALGL
jgi:hypothetical protein